jgi:2-dehydro-3-deoxyphosphooctonate aldolase (KDO 8-P synthase)
MLEKVKSETGLQVLTDIHDPSQAVPAAEVADVIQIPAFLCRQTSLLEAAGAAGRTVNVKKGQFYGPREHAGIRGQVETGGLPEVWLTERGTFFGYGDLWWT